MNVLVLAGGRSQRFGRDKRLVDVGGRPLLDRTLAVVRDRGMPLFLAVDPRDDVLGRLPGVARLDDRRPGSGPLPALVDALTWLDDALLCLAADLPALDAAFVDWLLDSARGRAKAPVVVPGHRDRLEPLCAVYRPAALEPLRVREERGQLGLQEALGDMVGVAVVTPPSSRALLNLNRAGDLAAVRDSTGRTT